MTTNPAKASRSIAEMQAKMFAGQKDAAADSAASTKGAGGGEPKKTTRQRNRSFNPAILAFSQQLEGTAKPGDKSSTAAPKKKPDLSAKPIRVPGKLDRKKFGTVGVSQSMSNLALPGAGGASKGGSVRVPGKNKKSNAFSAKLSALFAGGGDGASPGPSAFGGLSAAPRAAKSGNLMSPSVDFASSTGRHKRSATVASRAISSKLEGILGGGPPMMMRGRPRASATSPSAGVDGGRLASMSVAMAPGSHEAVPSTDDPRHLRSQSLMVHATLARPKVGRHRRARSRSRFKPQKTLISEDLGVEIPEPAPDVEPPKPEPEKKPDGDGDKAKATDDDDGDDDDAPVVRMSITVHDADADADAAPAAKKENEKTAKKDGDGDADGDDDIDMSDADSGGATRDRSDAAAAAAVMSIVVDAVVKNAETTEKEKESSEKKEKPCETPAAKGEKEGSSDEMDTSSDTEKPAKKKPVVVEKKANKKADAVPIPPSPYPVSDTGLDKTKSPQKKDKTEDSLSPKADTLSAAVSPRERSKALQVSAAEATVKAAKAAMDTSSDAADMAGRLTPKKRKTSKSDLQTSPGKRGSGVNALLRQVEAKLREDKDVAMQNGDEAKKDTEKPKSKTTPIPLGLTTPAPSLADLKKSLKSSTGSKPAKEESASESEKSEPKKSAKTAPVPLGMAAGGPSLSDLKKQLKSRSAEPKDKPESNDTKKSKTSPVPLGLTTPAPSLADLKKGLKKTSAAAKPAADKKVVTSNGDAKKKDDSNGVDSPRLTVAQIIAARNKAKASS